MKKPNEEHKDYKKVKVPFSEEEKKIIKEVLENKLGEKIKIKETKKNKTE